MNALCIPILLATWYNPGTWFHRAPAPATEAPVVMSNEELATRSVLARRALESMAMPKAVADWVNLTPATSADDLATSFRSCLFGPMPISKAMRDQYVKRAQDNLEIILTKWSVVIAPDMTPTEWNALSNPKSPLYPATAARAVGLLNDRWTPKLRGLTDEWAHGILNDMLEERKAAAAKAAATASAAVP